MRNSPPRKFEGASEFLAPINQELSGSFDFHENTRPFISCLFVLCGPSAIFRTIVSIIINSLNGVGTCRRQSHISDEVREGIPPLFTNFNASPSVILVNRFRRAFTPGYDFHEPSVNQSRHRICVSPRSPVRKLSDRLFLAPAGSCFPSKERILSDEFLPPALACKREKSFSSVSDLFARYFPLHINMELRNFEWGK